MSKPLSSGNHASFLTPDGVAPISGEAPTLNNHYAPSSETATTAHDAAGTETATATAVGHEQMIQPASVSPASTLSPVMSRDFAAELAATKAALALEQAKTEHLEKAVNAGTAGESASTAGAQTSATIGAAAPAQASTPGPRMRALKSFVGVNTTPADANANALDLEKGTGRAPSPTNRNPRLANILEPKKPLKPAPTWKTSVINIMKYSWLNVLLVFVPAAFAVEYTHANPTAIFCVSFAAIVPLAALLGFATEEIALRVGHTLGGLLNATFGNTVELIIAILALTKGELRVVQASMIGSILSNCLLVLGMCFFAGGIRFHEQVYTVRSAQLNSSLLGISALAIVVPAAFHAAVGSLNPDVPDPSQDSILKLSRGVAFILLFVYVCYLFFQFWTHDYLYAHKPSVQYRSRHHKVRPDEEDEPQPPENTSVLRIPSWRTHSSDSDASSIRTANTTATDDSDEEDSEEPRLKIQAAFILIVIVTAFTGLVAEFLVSSIDGLTASGAISREFVALILLPVVGNAAEHVTAVTVSVKDKLDLSIAVAVGSSIQISLFVIPLLVILGWIIGQPLDLQFDVLETITLFVSMVIVTQALSDGKSNWLEGMTLMVVYLIIGVTFFFYPGLPEIA